MWPHSWKFWETRWLQTARNSSLLYNFPNLFSVNMSKVSMQVRYLRFEHAIDRVGIGRKDIRHAQGGRSVTRPPNLKFAFVPPPPKGIVQPNSITASVMLPRSFNSCSDGWIGVHQTNFPVQRRFGASLDFVLFRVNGSTYFHDDYTCV